MKVIWVGRKRSIRLSFNKNVLQKKLKNKYKKVNVFRIIKLKKYRDIKLTKEGRE